MVKQEGDKKWITSKCHYPTVNKPSQQSITLFIRVTGREGDIYPIRIKATFVALSRYSNCHQQLELVIS